MSILSSFDLAEPGWGLTEDDLKKIVSLEKMRDITKNFSHQIKLITKRFDSIAGIKIVTFDENSGVDSISKEIFASLIAAQRYIFYQACMSNRETCVIFVYGSIGAQKLESNEHTLCHEYAHHIQFAHAGFPFYVYKKLPMVWTPPFVKPYEIGPVSGSAFVDSLLLPDLQDIIQDTNERISDIICEGLLREKALTSGMLEYYLERTKSRRDPYLDFPPRLRTPSLRRYIRRLALRDCAEFAAYVQLAYPNRNLTTVFSPVKKFAVKLNKKYIAASQIYDEIFKLCKVTDFHSFRSPDNVVSYTKKVLNLLNIKIKTSENW